MNTVVFVIAGVLVAAGLVLIVLSFLVGRARPQAAETEPEPSTSTDEAEETAAFIDEPLAADMSELLEDRKKRAADAPTEAASSSSPTETSPADADAPESGATSADIEGAPSPGGDADAAPESGSDRPHEGDAIDEVREPAAAAPAQPEARPPKAAGIMERLKLKRRPVSRVPGHEPSREPGTTGDTAASGAETGAASPDAPAADSADATPDAPDAGDAPDSADAAEAADTADTDS